MGTLSKLKKRYFGKKSMLQRLYSFVWICMERRFQDTGAGRFSDTHRYSPIHCKGFREGYRVLRPGGHAVYNISIVGDHTSENTKKWEYLYGTLDESYSLHEKLYDIEEWEQRKGSPSPR